MLTLACKYLTHSKHVQTRENKQKQRLTKRVQYEQFSSPFTGKQWQSLCIVRQSLINHSGKVILTVGTHLEAVAVVERRPL